MAVQEVPLTDAATRLGLTPDAVRLRLRRGKTLQGIKRGREWYVLLDDATPDVTGCVDGHDRSADATGQDGDAPATQPVTDELVEQLRGEVVFLRQQVEALHERLREAHLLAAQQLALPAAAEAASFAHDAQNSHAATFDDGRQNPTAGSANDLQNSRPWWRRWAWWR
jgi:hypothetical protein